MSRITPAHAGKTAILERRESAGEDHPRACGENGVQNWATELETGSPPRMRGKHTTFSANGKKPRITPAHAGKTLDG